ncbi:MAG TPA: glycosyltransferase 87 family protein [Streptosporangiaceae bacterium]
MRTRPGAGLLAAGLAAFCAAVGGYAGYASTHRRSDWMQPVDLRVYRFGGFIAAHAAPWYDPGSAAPLYDWPGYLNLKFTYPPFAALVFTALTVPGLRLLEYLSVGLNIVALVAAIWFTLGGLDRQSPDAAAQPASTLPGRSPHREHPAVAMAAVRPRWASRRVRAGATLLIAAVAFWSEPVQRVLFLGQVELVLMALVLWDVCQPDRRWWKGAGIGIAAGVKLVPLIFIPYLLLTRRFRQAAIAAGVFAITVALGFAAMPGSASRWWLGGLFARGSRTGFAGWEGNQSLLALTARLAGSVAAGTPFWLAAAIVATVAGLACAAVLDRAGYPLVGVLTCALTGVLVSPISWDHHWVWVVPGLTVLGWYAVRSRGRLRWALLGLAVTIAGIFAAWPGAWLGEPRDPGGFSLGLIWLPPNTSPGTYYLRGDQPWYPEYHWRGTALLTGNLYILTGILLLAGLISFAVVARRRSRRPDSHMTASPAAAQSSTAGATPTWIA